MIKRPNLLQSRLFLAGLVVLVLNDHYFKSAYPGWFTGKVSDFAGLFILPIFFSAVSSGSIALNCSLSALIFFIWKSPLVEPLITAGNAMGIPFHRTIDPTDLIALTMLPLSYWYLKTMPPTDVTGRKLALNLLAVVCFASLTSTTLAMNVEADMKKSYRLKLSKRELLKEIENLNCELHPEVSEDGDTVYLLSNLVVENDSIIRTARFRIRERNNGTVLTLLNIRTFRSYPVLFTLGSKRPLKRVARKYLIEEIE